MTHTLHPPTQPPKTHAAHTPSPAVQAYILGIEPVGGPVQGGTDVVARGSFLATDLGLAEATCELLPCQ